MNLQSLLAPVAARLGFQPAPGVVETRAPRPRPNVSVVVRTSAQPTYANGWGAQTLLPRPQSFELLYRFYRAIPALGRAIDILAGYVGTPAFVVEGNEAAGAELDQWGAQVGYGYLGQGLRPWIHDHLTQTLLYGYGVGECELGPGRTVDRLWSYRSPAFGFRAEANGALSVVQNQGLAGEKTLNADTVLVTTHRPEGCEPNGQSLFFASPTFCGAWLDIAHNLTQTWKRNGTPSFHWHYEPLEGEDLNDPEGTDNTIIAAALEAQFNEAMRSKVLDGLAKDMFTAGGKISHSSIGADAQVLEIEPAKRAIVEEIVVATGIPGWLLGYSTWSSTERLSSQQADMLLATVDTLRGTVGGTLLKAAQFRQRMAGKRDGLAVGLAWPDVNLQDRLQTAQAALGDANAALAKQKFAVECWRLGWWDQGAAAEYATGSDEVAKPMAEPPAATPARPGNEPGGGSEARGAKRLPPDPYGEWLEKYDPHQPRDDHGRWVAHGGGSAGIVNSREYGPISLRQGTDEDRARFRVPPGYTNLRVADLVDEGSPLQWVATGGNGKDSYHYSDEHYERKAREKHERVAAVDAALPAARAKWDLEAFNGGAKAHEAHVLRLVHQTGFRNGGDGTRTAIRENGQIVGYVDTYGASTLKTAHARVEGDRVHFDFPGKAGVRQRHSITDPQLAAHVRARQEAGEERLFDTSDSRVRTYLKRTMEGDYKVHDLRTWNATSTAAAVVERINARGEAPQTERELGAAINRASRIAARRIGDTVSVARDTYISPLVWQEWRVAVGARLEFADGEE